MQKKKRWDVLVIFGSPLVEQCIPKKIIFQDTTGLAVGITPLKSKICSLILRGSVFLGIRFKSFFWHFHKYKHSTTWDAYESTATVKVRLCTSTNAISPIILGLFIFFVFIGIIAIINWLKILWTFTFIFNIKNLN